MIPTAVVVDGTAAEEDKREIYLMLPKSNTDLQKKINCQNRQNFSATFIAILTNLLNLAMSTCSEYTMSGHRWMQHTANIC